VNSVVLDASALLALVFDEPGAEKVGPTLQQARISAVNLSEVVAKATERGMSLETITAALDRLPFDVMDFDAEAAYLAASLRPQTRALGLSLGDRACLALGMHMKMPVMTTDRKWAKASLDLEVIVLR
jgi:PIN domain nuclease of toxin-antitoxin system